MRKNLDSTWLMIKRHRITGLLYFCKTSRGDPLRYIGSGRYWKNHIRKHGKYIDTIWCKEFLNQEELTNYALFISHYFDVVHSKDNNGNKIWANLEIENGINGMPIGTDRGESFKNNCRILNKGNKNSSYGKYWWTNGIDSIKSNICPEGWWRGRSTLFKKHISTIKRNELNIGRRNPSYGKYWWTNGIDSVKSTKCPEGWVRGVGTKFREKASPNSKSK